MEKKNFSVEVYFDKELLQLTDIKNQKKIDEIVNCYIAVFNESWGEQWNYASALEEVMNSFSYLKNRTPIAVFLYRQKKLVGFSWGIITDRNGLLSERDMPFSSNTEEKIEGMDSLKFFLNLKKCEKILIFREIGVLKEFRGKKALALTFPIIKKAKVLGCDYAIYWTSPISASLNLGISLGFWPLKFFTQNNTILMIGKMNYIHSILKGLSEKFNPIARILALREIEKNLSKF